MIDKDKLVVGSFYYLKFNDGDSTVGLWYGRSFDVCGSDFPAKYEEFSEIYNIDLSKLGE